jgi:hypothetical protein
VKEVQANIISKAGGADIAPFLISGVDIGNDNLDYANRITIIGKEREWESEGV